jgi:hypothetical protein
MRSNIFLKIQKVASNPYKFKQFFLLRANQMLSLIFDWVMFYSDRVISVVFVLIYDMGALLRKKNNCSVDMVLTAWAYQGDLGVTNEIVKDYLVDTLFDYVDDPEKVSIYYWDDGQPLVGNSFNFYKKVTSLSPKYLILSSWNFRSFGQPMKWVLARLKKKNICVIALWCDACSSGFAESIFPVLDIVDVHAIMDNPSLDLGESHYAQLLKKKAKAFLHPFEIELEESKRERDIDIVFFGQVSSYRSIRKSYIEFLLNSDVNFYCHTGSKEERFPDDVYFKILSRAKIGLSLSMSVDRHQLKKQLIDTMYSGGLVMSERNPQIASIFLEGEDYVAFSSKEELLEKINYYLEHEDERNRIAKSGYRKVRQLFNGKRFWNALLNP